VPAAATKRGAWRGADEFRVRGSIGGVGVTRDGLRRASTSASLLDWLRTGRARTCMTYKRENVSTPCKPILKVRDAYTKPGRYAHTLIPSRKSGHKWGQDLDNSSFHRHPRV
jgi:hypothetical protein